MFELCHGYFRFKYFFDQNGVCDYCNNYHSHILPSWDTSVTAQDRLQSYFDHIKKNSNKDDYHCLIGLSGGVDSSYVTYIAKEKFGLKPLLYHVDAGWNSQQAVNNIEKLVKHLNLELYTEVINWPEMRDLQLSFFKANVPHLDTPQDHAFFAGLYNYAASNKIKHILTGANFSTECVREPLEWHYHASDLSQLIDIHQKHGTVPLNTFPLAGIFKYKIFYRFFKGIRVIKPLNSIKYIKDEAIKELSEKFEWQVYKHKHYESRFTRFYEGFWLPTKFGYDKRRAHFSSLILTNQMTREEALRELRKNAYDEDTIREDFEYVASKLKISTEELKSYLNGPKNTYMNYKNDMYLINLGTKLLKFLGIQKSIIR